jgi:hypothetical protein
MAQVRKAPGRICIRIASGFDFKIMRQGGHERILAAAGKHGVPVMNHPGGEYAALTNYVRKFDSVPYRDLIAQLRRVVDAFGVKRLMWASDYTVTVDHHTYAESLFCIRGADTLSENDKEWILGKTAREVLAWPRPA